MTEGGSCAGHARNGGPSGADSVGRIRARRSGASASSIRSRAASYFWEAVWVRLRPSARGARRQRRWAILQQRGTGYGISLKSALTLRGKPVFSPPDSRASTSQGRPIELLRTCPSHPAYLPPPVARESPTPGRSPSREGALANRSLPPIARRGAHSTGLRAGPANCSPARTPASCHAGARASP